MPIKEIKELIGLAMIGEGVVGFFNPQKYTMFWKFKCEIIESVKQKAAENPEITRIFYAAEVVLGIWLAKSQLKNLRKNVRNK